MDYRAYLRANTGISAVLIRRLSLSLCIFIILLSMLAGVRSAHAAYIARSHKSNISISPASVGALLTGRVTFNGVAIPGAELVLYFYNGTQWSIYSSSLTNANGEYSFAAPTLNSDIEAYAVTWDNVAKTSDQLAYWICNLVSLSQLSFVSRNCSFDLANVSLNSPDQGSAVDFPIQFSWTRRIVTADQYAVDIFDEANSNGLRWQSSAVPYFKGSTEVSVNNAPPIETNKVYSWQVTVYGANGFGVSNAKKTIRFAHPLRRVYIPSISGSAINLPSPSQLKGRITQNNLPVGGLTVKQWFYDGSKWTNTASTQTNQNGDYVFSSLPTLNDDTGLIVTWSNDTQTTGRLIDWNCLPVTNQSQTFANATCSFDVADVVLTGPAPGATKNVPVTFGWNRRQSTPSDSYEVNVLDTTTSDTNTAWWWSEPTHSATFMLDYLPQWLASNKSLAWWVRVYGANGFGNSYYYSNLTFGSVTVKSESNGETNGLQASALAELKTNDLQSGPNVLLKSQRVGVGLEWSNILSAEPATQDQFTDHARLNPAHSKLDELTSQFAHIAPSAANSTQAAQNSNLIIFRLGTITQFTSIQGSPNTVREQSLLRARFENAAIVISPVPKYILGFRIDGEFCIYFSDNSNVWCGNVKVQNQNTIALSAAGGVTPMQMFIDLGTNGGVQTVRVFYTPVSFVAGVVNGIPGGGTSFRTARFNMSCCR